MSTYNKVAYPNAYFIVFRIPISTFLRKARRIRDCATRRSYPRELEAGVGVLVRIRSRRWATMLHLPGGVAEHADHCYSMINFRGSKLDQCGGMAVAMRDSIFRHS